MCVLPRHIAAVEKCQRGCGKHTNPIHQSNSPHSLQLFSAQWNLMPSLHHRVLHFYYPRPFYDILFFFQKYLKPTHPPPTCDSHPTPLPYQPSIPPCTTAEPRSHIRLIRVISRLHFPLVPVSYPTRSSIWKGLTALSRRPCPAPMQ